MSLSPPFARGRPAKPIRIVYAKPPAKLVMSVQAAIVPTVRNVYAPKTKQRDFMPLIGRDERRISGGRQTKDASHYRRRRATNI